MNHDFFNQLVHNFGSKLRNLDILPNNFQELRCISRLLFLVFGVAAAPKMLLLAVFVYTFLIIELLSVIAWCKLKFFVSSTFRIIKSAIRDIMNYKYYYTEFSQASSNKFTQC